MKRIFVQTLLLLLTLLSTSPLFAHGTIVINNVEHSKGYIDVKIYDNKNSFLKEELAKETIRKRATKGKTVVPLSKIHEGQIAIVVYHDEDGDGKKLGNNTKNILFACTNRLGGVLGIFPSFDR